MSDLTRAKASTQFRSLFKSLVLDPELVLGEVLSTEWIAEVVAREVAKTRDRIFTPLVTLALFLGQVFSDDHSCRSVVARLLAWRLGMRPAGMLTRFRWILQSPATTA